MPTFRRRRPSRASYAALVLVLIIQAPAAAHDIPTDVALTVFVRAEGSVLRVIVRAPVAAMRDVQFPVRDGQALDLSRADAAVRHAAMMWLADGMTLCEDGKALRRPALTAVRVSLPSDRAFSSFDRALAHVTGEPLAPDTVLVWNQALIDALFEYEIRSDRSAFAIAPAFARLGLRVTTVVRFTTSSGIERAFDLAGDPGVVTLDPRWHQAAWTFVRSGFFHILDGTDHLLFLFCLVLPFRRLRPLVIVVTAFTIAHSATLAAAASNLGPDALWFPPLVETLIAASIVYMALENIVGSAHLRQNRWAVAFAFGLIHGFGFAFALRETLQLAGAHVITSLLAFNLGVEIGQIAVLAVMVPAVQLLFRYVVAERMGTIILSAIVAHTAWHWMVDRWQTLARFGWPAIGAAEAAPALRWLLALLVAGAVVWGWSIVKRIYRPAPQSTER
ncbi:MAG TPA: HupE/UreJ family protein [Vicinamibacterales bacterium]|nr:HupE/UreJ family protein [Vicinamibacterales bacterium]